MWQRGITFASRIKVHNQLTLGRDDPGCAGGPEVSRRVFKVGGVRVKDAALLALKGEDEAGTRECRGL